MSGMCPKWREEGGGRRRRRKEEDCEGQGEEWMEWDIHR